MAIIFVSPKRRQRIIMLSLIALLAVSVAGIGVFAFWPEIKSVVLGISPEEQVAAMPGVKINFSVVDSQKVKNLELFTPLQVPGPVEGRENPFTSYQVAPKPPKK